MLPFSKDSNIAIVGLGIIGGSLAMALERCGYTNINGVDISDSVCQKAVSLGIFKSVATQADEIIAKADITFLAVYPWLVASILKTQLNNFKPGSVVIDTSGVKCSINDELQSFWRNDVDFIATHPMAGREQGGLANACADLFDGANMIITPQPSNKQSNLEATEQLCRRLRFGRIFNLSIQEHDEIIAYTSNLPHIMAVSLVNSTSFDDNTGSFIGGSFRDASRVAKINSNLWTQLFLSNKDNILKEITAFKQQLDLLTQAISQDDTAALKNMLDKANNNRGKLCTK